MPPPPPPPPPLPHPPTSTLTYLRTQHDVPPKPLLKTRRELTKSALLSSKTHTSLEKTRLKQEKKLAEARREEAVRPRLVAWSRDGGGDGRRGRGTGRGMYMAFLVFQLGFAGMLVLATMLGGRRGRYLGPKGKFHWMGETVVFELVLSILVMVSGVLWGVILILLGVRDAKTGKDWLGLREVSLPTQIQDAKLGKRDLEAGLGDVRYGYDERKRERVKIIKICVWDAHRLDHSPPSNLRPNKSHLTKKNPTAEKLQQSSSSSISNPPGNRNHRYKPHHAPPTPKISINTSPIHQPAKEEEFILLPPPPPTASRSRAGTRPKTWVYTRDIPLNTLAPEGIVTERREKTLSLQLGDVSVVDGERGEGDEVFVVGGEDDE